MKKFFLSLIIGLLIFGPVTGSVPLAHAQVNPSENPYQSYENEVGECWALNKGIDIGMCFAWVMYFFAWITSSFAELTAMLMDYFLAYSLDSGSYSGANNQFVEMGWSIIRDIANIFFIFTLLYIAIRHILQMGGSDTKKLLTSLIIAALLINFSLFFTKVIIDSSNILARAFYNNIVVENDDNLDHKSISQALVSQVNPQKLISSDMFKPVPAPGRLPTEPDAGWLITIFFLATIVNIAMAWIFLSTFLLFIARVIGLWFMMIFSPIALASRAIPGAEGMLGDFGWSGWIKSTLKLAFMAPIFVFFLFLLTMFLNVALQSVTVEVDQSTMQRIMSVLIPFMAIIIIMTKAKDTATEMAGTFGQAVLSGVGKLAGFAVGAAGVGLAGTAMVARGTIGRAATAAAGSRSFQEAASKNKYFLAKSLYKGAQAASKGSMDARNSTGFRRTTGLLASGLAAAGIATKADLGKGTTRGGYSQRLEEYQKKKEKFKEDLKSSDHDTFSVTDPRDPTKTLTTSVIQAETEFLKAQNEAKRKDENKNIKSATIGNPREDVVKDYDGWVKEKEKAEKAQKQAEIDFANVQRDPASTLVQKDAARVKKDYFTDRHAEIRGVVKGIEENWETEEKIFKGIKREQTKHDTKVLQQYAESVKPVSLDTSSLGAGIKTGSMVALAQLYGLANGSEGTYVAGRSAASAELARSAEKEEKKAQAEAKKDDKKT